jgi:hypothetical protein
MQSATCLSLCQLFVSDLRTALVLMTMALLEDCNLVEQHNVIRFFTSEGVSLVNVMFIVV